MKTWTLISYTDVWGNVEDGWTVNDQTPIFNDLVITDDASDQDILTYLKSIDFLTTDSLQDVEMESDGDMIEISEAGSGYPIGRLTRNVL